MIDSAKSSWLDENFQRIQSEKARWGLPIEKLRASLANSTSIEEVRASALHLCNFLEESIAREVSNQSSKTEELKIYSLAKLSEIERRLLEVERSVDSVAALNKPT